MLDEHFPLVLSRPVRPAPIHCGAMSELTRRMPWQVLQQFATTFTLKDSASDEFIDRKKIIGDFALSKIKPRVVSFEEPVSASCTAQSRKIVLIFRVVCNRMR